MTFFGGKKVDYVIRSHDQIPTVMWPNSYGQVGNWTHNPNLVISLHNKFFYMLEKSEKILKNIEKIPNIENRAVIAKNGWLAYVIKNFIG